MVDRQEDIVVVRNVQKEFVLPQYKNRSIKQAFINILRRPELMKQKALEDISFTVKKGDFFGVVGRNGSGKSTMLKILAGVYQPNAGSVEIRGKLTPFIELGVGFNPELSGRDNVFLNGALLGFTRKQMEAMYDEIVDFAEIPEFMDQKLKNYSSGMQVRLAFSIAIKAKNEILIFDEVLAVGDEAFQRKCFDIFEQYKAEGQTVILVSHDMGAIRNFCNRAVLIDDGKVVDEGNPDKIATTYSTLNQQRIDDTTIKQNAVLAEGQRIKHLYVNITDQHNRAMQSFKYGEQARVLISVSGLKELEFESIGVTIVKQSGEHLGGLNTRIYEGRTNWRKKGKISLDLDLNFSPGKYHVYAELFSAPGRPIEGLVGPSFEIISSKPLNWSGLTQLSAKWTESEK